MILPIRDLLPVVRRDYKPATATGIAESWPVPTRAGGTMRLQVMICVVLPEYGYGLLYSPPKALVFIDPYAGKVESAKDVTPADFGQSVAPGTALDYDKADPDRDQYARDVEALYTALDILLSAYAEGVNEAQPNLKEAATTFKRVFAKVAEEVLMPYYHAIGKDWFAWLDRMAGT